MATIKPLSVSAKRLAATISGSATSFKLDNILAWDGVTNLVAGDFGTKAYAAFRNSAGTLVEFMEIDPSTIASASITILYRGLAYNGDNLTTEISANKLTWVKGDTIVELGTHLPQLLAHYVDIVGPQTIAGVKTFTSTPINTGGNPTASNELATKAYVDLIGTGTATMNKVVVAGTAGETITVGQLVYLKVSDGRWWLCDADTAATVDNINLGIAQGAGSAAGAITSGVLTYGLDTNQTGLTANTVYYASNTAGGISTSAGTVEVTVGLALSTTSIFFAPRYNQQITEDQQDALAGSLGTPSSTNKYVSQSGLQAQTGTYYASAVGTDSYAITPSPAIAAYAMGMKFAFSADVANTGACTLAVSGLSALAIKKLNDQDLVTGDIEAGQIVEVVYDGTDFQMQSQLGQMSSVNCNIQTFTSSGTYTKPANAIKVLVQAWGGGGSGSARTSSTGGTGGGGGGEYYEKWLNASDVGATETVTIGAGGASVTTANNGNNGGVTTFGSLTTTAGGGGGAASANDGIGGSGGSPLGTATLLWGAGVSGAAGGAGVYSSAGGGGVNATSGSNGGASIYGGAGGGGASSVGAGSGGTSTYGGAGGAAANGAGATATAGSAPGGGGGGATSSNGTVASGAGAAGKMIVTTFL